MMEQTICTLAAILAITVIEYAALRKGINGKAIAASLAIIGGLGGFSLGQAF